MDPQMRISTASSHSSTSSGSLSTTGEQLSTAATSTNSTPNKGLSTITGNHVSTTMTSNDCQDIFDGPAYNSREFKFNSTLSKPEQPDGAISDSIPAEDTNPAIDDATNKIDNINVTSNVSEDISKEDDDGNISDGSFIDRPLYTAGMSSQRRFEVSRKRVTQHMQYLKITEDRISSLEMRLNFIDKKGLPKVDAAANKKPARMKAIPELNEVKWDEFKELRRKKDSTPRTHYAIDVLRGNPILYHQYRKRGKSLKTNNSASVEHADGSKATKGAIKDIPERIRINSVPLIRILSNVTSKSWVEENRPIVILRPFKPLIYHQESLYNVLTELEAQWGSLVDQDDTSTASETESSLLDGHEQNQQSTETSKTHGQTLGTDASGKNTERTSEATPEDKDGDGFDEKEDLANTVEALKDLRCLMKFIEETLKPLKEKFKSCTPESENIRFQDLWYLFRPGQYVYVKKGIQKVWRVLQATGGRPYLMDNDGSDSDSDGEQGFELEKTSPFALDCYCLDFDGTHLGPEHKVFRVYDFDGYKKISSLEVYPLEFSRDQDKISKTLTEQGEDFIKYMTITKRWYKGRTQVLTSSDKKRSGTQPADSPIRRILHEESIDSQVIIDFDRAFQHDPEWKPELGINDLHEQSQRETREMTTEQEQPEETRSRGDCRDEFCCKNEYIIQDKEWDRLAADELMAGETILRTPQSLESGYTVLPKDYMLLPSRVFGFVLRSRKWASLNISREFLYEEKREENSFDNLKLPHTLKKMVRALVETHFKNHELEAAQERQESESDIVRGKGQGLILLLHGAPGVGKTSTAECIAQSYGRPLFPITCGDLGLTAKDVEERLSQNFQLAQAWGCVLLLDEADVFLAQRSKNELVRNALVSVFLRELEYYSGILFLTTNRVGAIDEAFKSRIHMSLYYPPLSHIQTKEIWEMNLRRTLAIKENVIASKDEIVDYAMSIYDYQIKMQGVGWNGRQIRNALQTAIALAEYAASEEHDKITELAAEQLPPRKARFTIEHLQTVAQASWEFDDYLQKTRHGTDAEVANTLFLRTDNYQSKTGFMAPSPGYERYPGPADVRPGYQTTPLGSQATYQNPQAVNDNQGFLRQDHAPQGFWPYQGVQQTSLPSQTSHNQFAPTPQPNLQQAQVPQSSSQQQFQAYGQPNRHDSLQSQSNNQHSYSQYGQPSMSQSQLGQEGINEQPNTVSVGFQPGQQQQHLPTFTPSLSNPYLLNNQQSYPTDSRPPNL